MVRDLSDKGAPLRELQSSERRAQSATPLRSGSVSDGRMRFIGGLLRIEAGGRLEIEGTVEIDGTTTVTGTFTITGPWTITGNGTITGNVTMTGDFVVSGTGKIRAGNLTIDDAGGGRISHPTVLLLSAPITGTNALSVLGTLDVQSIATLTSGVFMTNLPTISRTSMTPNLPVGAMYAKASGEVFRAI